MKHREKDMGPLTFVVLDIIKATQGANWYHIEQRVPNHQDFVDFTCSARQVLSYLKENGYIHSEGNGPMPSLFLTSTGLQLHTELTPRHTFPAIATLEFDKECWAFCPRGPRFASWIRFEDLQDGWVMRASFLEFESEWSVKATVSLPDLNAPHDKMTAGTKFNLLSGGNRVVGKCEIIASAEVNVQHSGLDELGMVDLFKE